MEQMAKKYGYSREWRLFQRGIVVQDGVFLNLDGSPVTPGSVKAAVSKTNATKPVSPDTSKSDSKAPRPVLQFTMDGELVREWLSMMEAERNGFCHGNVSLCCLGKRKSAYGYVWKYKEDKR